jgi:CRP-like cAMP-binding protein
MRLDYNQLAHRLNNVAALSSAELDHLSMLQSTSVKILPGKELLHEGQSDHCAYILQKGWACSFKILPDGGRQIIGFPVAGDCIGLSNIFLPVSSHSLSVLTDATVSRLDVPQLTRVMRDFPRLGTAILTAVCQDEALVIEHLVNLGRRAPNVRMAHFFVELHARLRAVGLASETQFSCPLNQYVIADALGLSAIHVNRVLRQLRESNLFSLRKRTATMLDLPAMKRLAGYK